MRASLRTITLDRTGLIKVRVVGDRHCGAESAVVDGQVAVRYTVHLVVGPNDLDERDFLVDQEELHQFMVTTGSSPVAWHEPCELLSVMWGMRLEEWVRSTNLRCTIHELTLTISPAPHLGSFTATFTTEPRPAISASRAIDRNVN